MNEIVAVSQKIL